jgi:hypothetical protein
MTNCKKYFCINCGLTFNEDWPLHLCRRRFHTPVTESKKSLSGRFFDWFWSVDWDEILAFFGLVTMNCLLIPHFHLTLAQTILESFSWGLAIPRIIK